MTLSRAFERHRQDVLIFGDKSPKTEEQYACTLRSLIRFIGHDPTLKEFDFEMVRSWKAWLKHRGLAPRTIRGYIICLRVVLNYNLSRGYEVIDPTRIIIPPRIEQTPNVISSQEVDKLLELVDQTPRCSLLVKARNKAIISMLYGSGLRISELTALNRDDVKEDTFRVVGKMKKTGLCMMDQRTRDYINEYLALRTDNHECLFADNIKQGRLTPNSMRGLFRRLSRAGGFKQPVHPHTLRHSYATNLLKNGCHIYTLSRLMRHTSIATTQIYLHHYDQELVEAYAKYHSV